jgi:transmembrane sensor
MSRETSRQIEECAATWAARADRGLSPAESRELEAWLGADPRREGAFMRMRAIAIHSERAKALGPDFDPVALGEAAAAYVGESGNGVDPAALQPILDSGNENDALVPIGRRKFLWGSGAAAASLAILVAGGLTLMPRGQLYETRLGESRVVTLADGSVITLNTDTSLRVRFGEAERLIEFDHGEALFDVAHNAARPFIVLVDGARVRAVGTSFTVKMLADRPLAVMVAEGTVELTRPSIGRPVRISAESAVTVSDRSVAPRPVKVSRDDVMRETAWKDGRIAFEGESLSQAAGEFARYSEVRIVIDDPSVGREEITGLFASNDPVGFARAAALSLGLKAEIGNGEVRLTR